MDNFASGRGTDGHVPQPRPCGCDHGPALRRDWINGRAIEVFYADEELAHAFGDSPGWYWWSCYPGYLPDGDAFGPFPTSYRALKDAILRARPRA
jgi:hypothetical protein